jgi:hypothetical protein
MYARTIAARSGVTTVRARYASHRISIPSAARRSVRVVPEVIARRS